MGGYLSSSGASLALSLGSSSGAVALSSASDRVARSAAPSVAWSETSGVQVSGVVVHDRSGQPIPFARDSHTNDNLLRIVDRLNAISQPQAKDEIKAEDSVSNSGLVDATWLRQSSDASGATSSASCNSLLSCLVGEGDGGDNGYCFVAGSILRLSNGELVPVSQLDAGDRVLASSGRELRVRSIALHPLQEQSLVELHAINQAVLTVTRDHRVMVERGPHAQTMPAVQLRVGDRVYSTGEERKELVEIRELTEEVQVVQVRFMPDEPVEVFMPPILSKGHGWCRSTRRGHGNADTADVVSIPETEDFFNVRQ